MLGADVSLPLRVCIVGGGLVGLSLALRLAEISGANGRRVSVTVYDRQSRWYQADDFKYYLSVSGSSGGQPRWDQIVTLRDEVADLFRGRFSATSPLFEGERVWPGSRNVSVANLEAKLLARVQEADVAESIRLSLVPYEIEEILMAKEEWNEVPDTALASYINWVRAEASSLDVTESIVGGITGGLAATSGQSGIIVAADGAASLTRKAFEDDFEWIPLGEDATEAEDILGVALEEDDDETRHQQPRALAAALSASQRRYGYSPDCTSGSS